MLSGQILFLTMVVVAMLSLPLTLTWVVIDAWFEERRLAHLAQRRGMVSPIVLDLVPALA
jgi:hypothetical protein